VVTNPTPIIINDDPTAGEDGIVGTATPYPATLVVSGATGTITKLTVTFNGLSHTFPRDIDALLVGPAGQTVLLMSDVGGDVPASDVTLVFDDDAINGIGVTDPLTSGTFKPTQSGPPITIGEDPDVFPDPAPTPPYGTTLSVFTGLDPNGVYSLYIVDDFPGDTGIIERGFALTFSGVSAAVVPEPSTLTLSAIAMLCGVSYRCRHQRRLHGRGRPATAMAGASQSPKTPGMMRVLVSY
jgi:subtilisin-like proprotein convertase family protein